jgi:hypothetical protein
MVWTCIQKSERLVKGIYKRKPLGTRTAGRSKNKRKSDMKDLKCIQNREEWKRMVEKVKTLEEEEEEEEECIVYRPSFSWLRLWLDVSGQLHDPAALPQEKEFLVSIGLEAGWAAEPQSGRFGEVKILDVTGTRTCKEK